MNEMKSKFDAKNARHKTNHKLIADTKTFQCSGKKFSVMLILVGPNRSEKCRKSSYIVQKFFFTVLISEFI